MQLLFLFKIFGIPFFSYTTLVITGLLLACGAATWQMRRAGGHTHWGGQGAVWMAGLGLALGRLLHLLYNSGYYLEHPDQVLRFADGGMSFVGVFCGASLGLWFWAQRHGVLFWRAADWIALPAALLATFAWLGAFMYGSQYGAAAENWIALELRDTFGVILARWPTQLLAALWSAALGLVLLRLHHCASPKPDGTQAAVFWGLYSVGLFILDLTRGDSTIYILRFRLTQCLYLVLFLVASFHLGRNLCFHLTNPQKQTKI